MWDAGSRHASTIFFVSFIKASSTPSPVFALVLTTDQPSSASFHSARSSTCHSIGEIRLVQHQQERHRAR